MTIRHRIFLKAYKCRPLSTSKTKQTYKKFLGVKTLAIHKVEASKPGSSNFKKIKSKPSKKLFFLKPYILTGLSLKSIENEYRLASKDIRRLVDYAGLKSTATLKNIKNFRAFLPKEVWVKMSASARQKHLKKRRELQSKGVIIKDKTKSNRLKVSKNLVKFANRNSRPVLNLLSLASRRNYLRSFVHKAKFIAQNSFTDKTKKNRITLPKPVLSNKSLIRLNLVNIKKSLKGYSIKASTKKHLNSIACLPTITSIKISKIRKKAANIK